jgi:hypothetical protein
MKRDLKTRQKIRREIELSLEKVTADLDNLEKKFDRWQFIHDEIKRLESEGFRLSREISAETDRLKEQVSGIKKRVFTDPVLAKKK